MLLDQITVDHTLNVRAAIDEETVERYRAIFDRLPPVVVYHLPGDGVYLLADGFHRVEAAHRLGFEEVPAEVREGTRDDAEEYALTANVGHGQPLTRAERRRAIARMVRLRPERSDAWIARDLGVSSNTVRVVREELETTSQIARFDRLVGADGKERPREIEQGGERVRLFASEGAPGSAGDLTPALVTADTADDGRTQPALIAATDHCSTDVSEQVARVLSGKGVWCVLRGDCTTVLPEALPLASVDVIFADPPYYKMKEDWWDRQWKTTDEYVAWIGLLCQQWQKVLKPNGSLYVCASPDLAARVEVEIGKWFDVLNHLVWAKESEPTYMLRKYGDFHPRRYVRKSERLIFAEHCSGGEEYDAACDTLQGSVCEPMWTYLDAERRRAGISKETSDTPHR